MNDREQRIFRFDAKIISEEVAISSRNYSIDYIGHDGAVNRIEAISDGEIWKVYYPEVNAEFDQVLEVHRRQYPGVRAAISRPRRHISDDRFVFRCYSFDRNEKLVDIADCTVDAEERVLREVEYDNKEERVIASFEYLYDGYKLIKVLEFDSKGDKVGEMEL